MHKFFLRLSRLMAILGGIALCAVIVVTCLSILGRTLNTLLHGETAQAWFGGLANWLIAAGVGPIRGDFELVEAAMAFTIFAFLPLTQMTGGHATVDIFTAWLPPRAQRVLVMVIEGLFAAALVVIAWQLKAGMESKLRSGQVTFLLQFPLWWAYAASLSAATVAAVVGVYMAGVRVLEALTGRVIATESAGTASAGTGSAGTGH